MPLAHTQSAEYLAKKAKQKEKRRQHIIQDSVATAEMTKGKYGVFHDIPPLCVGDPYVDPVKVTRSFAKNKPNFKAGKNNSADGCFSVPPTLAGKTDGATKRRASTSSTKTPRKTRSEANLPAFRAGGKNRMGADPIYAFSLADRSMGRDQIRALMKKIKAEALQADKERIQRIREKTLDIKKNIVTNPRVERQELFLDAPVVPSGGKLKIPTKEERIEEAKRLVQERRQQAGDANAKPFCSATSTASKTFGRDEETYIHKPNCFVPKEELGKKHSNNEEQNLPPFKPTGTHKKPLHEDFPAYMPFTRPESAHTERRSQRLGGPSWRPSSASQTRPVRSVMLNSVKMKAMVRSSSAKTRR